jgi:hypothetical protein
MEGVEMRIGMDASVEAHGPKEESKARNGPVVFGLG